MSLSRYIFAAMLGCLLASFVPTTRAGTGPTDYLIVYDPDDATGVAIAQYYQQSRGIPDALMTPYSFPKSKTNSPSVQMRINTAQMIDLINFVRTTMTNRNLTTQIDGVLLAGATPNAFTISGGGTSGSIAAGLYTGPNITNTAGITSRFPTAGSDIGFNNLAYRSAGASALATTEMRADKDFSGEKYWVTTSIGFTGPRGNSTREIFNMLDRARAADGTKPDGTVYWPTNSDIRSAVRDWQLPDVTNEWATLGVDAIQYPGFIPTNKNGAPGSFPITNRAVIGAIIGKATFNLRGSATTYLPGAIAEHMTSFGAQYGETSQTKISSFIRVGAGGTGGAVAEPYAISVKFPHARIHSHYAAGASLGESFWESLSNPWMYFIVGDPLTQPFADFPQVAITNLVNNQSISGSFTVKYSVSTASASGVEANRDIAVDGRVIRIGDVTETVGATRVANGFALNTTTLSDGWHELRVIAYNNNAIRTQGHTKLGVFVSNASRSVTLTGPASLDRRTNAVFTAALGGSGTVTNFTLQTGGRTLTNFPVAGGSVTVSGALLAFSSTNLVTAVARYSDGSAVSSAPLPVFGAWSLSPAVTGVALTNTYPAFVNYFADAHSAGFSWTNTPTARTFYGSGANLAVIGTTSFPFITLDSNATSGHEFITYFNAPTNDLYEFILDDPQGEFTLLIDGVTQYTNVTGQTSTVNMFVAPEYLAAGRHEIRLRTRLTGTKNQFDFYVRGGGLYGNNNDTDDARISTNNSAAPNLPLDTFTPPQITITSPTNGQQFTGTRDIPITVTASGNSGVALVEYFSGTNLIGSSTTAPFNIVWSNAPAGTQTVTARVTDNVALKATSTAVSFNVVLTAPPVVVPDGGWFSQAQNVTITCADTNAQLHYTLDGRTPTLADPVVASGGTVLVSSNLVFKVTAFKTGFNSSEVHTATYRFGIGMISAGESSSFALASDGTLWGWGGNYAGELGLGNSISVSNATRVTALTNVVAIKLAHSAAFALTSDMTPWMWGYNYYNQLGDGTTTDRNLPGPITSVPDIALYDGNNNSLAVTLSGQLWAWGQNNFGGVGDNSTATRTVPKIITSQTNVAAVAVGWLYSVSLKRDGSVWAWGYNGNGELGDGTTTERHTPVKITTQSNIVAIAAGLSHTLTLGANGNVWATGNNDYGQLGDNTVVGKSNFLQVAAISNVTAIAAGDYFSMALRTDGTVWVWGYNTDGEVGNNTTVDVSLPTRTTGLTNIIAIAGGGYHCLALENNGTVWAWGYNTDSQLGDGTDVDRHTPVRVTGLNTIVQPDAPANFTATVISATQVNLAWTAPAVIPQGYQLERKTNAADIYLPLASAPANAIGFADTNCIPGRTHYYRLHATNSAATVEASATTPLTYAQWCLDNGLPTNGTGNGDSAAAPAGDGIPNLMKYALGLNPLISGYQGRFFTGTITLARQNYLQLTYTRPEPAPAGVSYVTEASAELAPPNWIGSNTVEIGNTTSNGTRTITVRDQSSTAAKPKDFMRLKISIIP